MSKLLNKQKIILIETTVDNYLDIVFDNKTIQVTVQNVSKAILNSKNFLNKADQYFTIDEFMSFINEDY